MSEVGGLIKLASIGIFSVIIPIIQYLYFQVMIKRLYFANLERKDIFLTEKKKPSIYVKNRLNYYNDHSKIPEDLKNTGFINDIKNHKEIRISCLDKFLLLIHLKIPFLNKISCWSKKAPLKRAFKKGQQKIFRDLNVYHLIKRLN